jgi:hypothetical protein
MIIRDPELNFEELWKTFRDRYPFFEVRGVDWSKQYEVFRPEVTQNTTEAELFDIICRMLDPLNDGHVKLSAKFDGERAKRKFTPEKTPRFWLEFTNVGEIDQLFKTTESTLVREGFESPATTEAWMLLYSRSKQFGYLRILELEGIGKGKLARALDKITKDFDELDGFIIDIRDCPGGDDSTAIAIINRFCDTERIAFHRKTKTGPDDADFGPLKTWYLKPEGDEQFTGPIVLLTCDSVFSGGECFALALKELPYVTLIGEHTNGIFSYELEKKLPNGWEYCLSYQKYFSADMICYEGTGVPVDIEVLNKRSDIESGTDPLITRALEELKSKVTDATGEK